MPKITLLGVDPGLIDTGVACVTLDPVRREWSVMTIALSAEEGDVTVALQNICNDLAAENLHIWVEKWRERGMITQEAQPMRDLEKALRKALPAATFLENMGAKKIVSNQLLDLFGLLHVQSTNHRDIQAAARIMLLGAIKDEDLNLAVYKFVTDALDGKPWAKQTQDAAA